MSPLTNFHYIILFCVFPQIALWKKNQIAIKKKWEITYISGLIFSWPFFGAASSINAVLDLHQQQTEFSKKVTKYRPLVYL